MYVMSSSYQLILYIAVMAIVTYLIRMIPLTLFQKKLNNRFIRSFLFYVPYSVLAAMTFPSILYSTDYTVSALVGCLIAMLLAYKEKGLLIVALSASAAVFISEWLIKLI